MVESVSRCLHTSLADRISGNRIEFHTERTRFQLLQSAKRASTEDDQTCWFGTWKTCSSLSLTLSLSLILFLLACCLFAFCVCFCLRQNIYILLQNIVFACSDLKLYLFFLAVTGCRHSCCRSRMMLLKVVDCDRSVRLLQTVVDCYRGVRLLQKVVDCYWSQRLSQKYDVTEVWDYYKIVRFLQKCQFEKPRPRNVPSLKSCAGRDRVFMCLAHWHEVCPSNLSPSLIKLHLLSVLFKHKVVM